jgi:hypothetical protein
VDSRADWRAAAAAPWTELGCPYDAALAQFSSGETDAVQIAGRGRERRPWAVWRVGTSWPRAWVSVGLPAIRRARRPLTASRAHNPQLPRQAVDGRPCCVLRGVPVHVAGDGNRAVPEKVGDCLDVNPRVKP